MRELSLFTGAGGGLLGSMLLGWEPVQFVEHDAYCQRVLAARFPDVPCHSDVRDFHPEPGRCDIVTGGFPCQPFSVAGKQLGEDDPRNMWPHAVRVLRESRAPLGFFENVPGLLSSGYFGTVLGDLHEAGFDAEWCVLGADDVGAPHRRKRLWILAYCEDFHESWAIGGRDRSWRPETQTGDCGCSPWEFDPADRQIDHGQGGHRESLGCRGEEQEDIPDTERGRCGRAVCEVQEHGPDAQAGREACDAAVEAGDTVGANWLAEPYVGRVAHGVASRVDRLRALGNGQVPHTMAAAWTILARAAGLY